MLPNFICVGAQKAGSSSLYKLLKSHPELHVSEQKEIHYYNIEENYAKGLKHYESYFDEGYQGQKWIGEFTPDYLQYTFVPDRIKKDLGDIKILIILRHPVDRAYSQFNFHKMNLHEDHEADFESCMKEESPVLGIASREEWYYPAYYKSKSLYFEQVKRYIDTFGKENVHLIVFEEMLKDRNCPDLKATCQFLGINDEQEFVSNHSNPTILNFNSGYIKTLRGIKDLMLKVVPEKVMRPLTDRVIQQTYQKPDRLDRTLRDQMYKEYFLEDVQKLEALCGIDLSIWNS